MRALSVCCDGSSTRKCFKIYAEILEAQGQQHTSSQNSTQITANSGVFLCSAQQKDTVLQPGMCICYILQAFDAD